jgi:hypothetical protein
VGVDDVDVFEVESLQRGCEPLDDVFAGQAVIVDEDLAVDCAPVDLVVFTISRGKSLIREQRDQ